MFWCLLMGNGDDFDSASSWRYGVWAWLPFHISSKPSYRIDRCDLSVVTTICCYPWTLLQPNRTTINISVHRWSRYNNLLCLRAQARFEPTFSDCESDALATRLTWPQYSVMVNSIGQLQTLSFFLALCVCDVLEHLTYLLKISWSREILIRPAHSTNLFLYALFINCFHFCGHFGLQLIYRGSVPFLDHKYFPRV